VSEKVSDQTPTTRQAQEAPSEDMRVPCEVYSRIVGYVRPIRNWNKGKQQEFAERKTYRVDGASGEQECEQD
jgi:anaerobic ribonucleoside-triphosphate reductase